VIASGCEDVGPTKRNTACACTVIGRFPKYTMPPKAAQLKTMSNLVCNRIILCLLLGSTCSMARLGYGRRRPFIGPAFAGRAKSLRDLHQTASRRLAPALPLRRPAEKLHRHRSTTWG